MQSDFNKLSDFLEPNDLFNGNLLVAENDKILFSKSIGFTFNPDLQSKLNFDSIFELASVSKQFTAFAVVLLFEQKSLSLDSKIEDYITGFVYPDISIRELLNHTSGLPDYFQIFDEHWDKTKIADNVDVLELLKNYQPPIRFKPKEKWEYSNTGYVLLASIIEKVSGKKFAEYLIEAVFEPLEMKNTFVHNRRVSLQIVENYAFGVIFDETRNQFILPENSEPDHPAFYLDGIQGDGTVNSTLGDLLKWNNAILQQKLISEESYLQIFKPTTTLDGQRNDYGFGWLLSDDAEFGKIAFHGGSWFGYETYNSIYLDKGISLVFLCNKPQSNEIEQQIILALENIAFGKPFELPKI